MIVHRLEKYTNKRPQEVLIVKIELDGETDEIAIFKGFSSSLMRPTAFDPDIPVLPDSAKIIEIDRLSSPYNPTEPDYIQQYLLENILHLNKTKKTFGKNTLLKPLPVLLEYNGKTLYDYYSEYKVFFDKIKNAL